MTNALVTKLAINIGCLFTCITLVAQQPKYTPKHLVSKDDPNEFVRIVPEKDGVMRTYLLITPEIWDVDDDNTTYIRSGQRALVMLQGEYKDGQREGPYTAYVFDSLDHKKRYKIWDQTYAHNKLNGIWRTYSLKGNVVNFRTYKDDSLNGKARNLWIDGISVMEEREYFNGQGKYILKEFSHNGKVAQETTFINNVPNGPAKKFYPDGTLQDEVVLKNGVPDGLRKYYYPSGKIWVETEMRGGKPWTIIANYTEDGKKRSAGTLKEGNGTMILYNDDGTVRETIMYKNGLESK